MRPPKHVALLLSIVSLIFFSACGGSLKKSEVVNAKTPPIVVPDVIIPTPTPVPVSATIVRLNSSNVPATDSSVETGQIVRFRISASGGFGRYVLVSFGGSTVNASFNAAAIEVPTLYSMAASGYQQSAVVSSYDLDGVKIDEVTIQSTAFNITAPPINAPLPTFVCQASSNLTKGTIPVDANRVPSGPSTEMIVSITHNGLNPNVTVNLPTNVTATMIAAPPGSVNVISFSIRSTAVGTPAVSFQLTPGSGQQTTGSGAVCGLSLEVKDQVQRYVDGLYTDLLGRARLASEGAALESQVYAKQTLRNVAYGMLNTVEYHTKVIREYFVKYLNRQPDAAGLLFYQTKWNEFDANSQPAQSLIQRAILGSQECQNRFATPEEYVEFVFMQLFERAPAVSEKASGLTYFNDYGGTMLVEEYLATDSFLLRFISGIYRSLLRREPDAAGLNHHLGQMQNGVQRITKVGDFAGTPEYFNLRLTRPDL